MYRNRSTCAVHSKSAFTNRFLGNVIGIWLADPRPGSRCQTLSWVWSWYWYGELHELDHHNCQWSHRNYTLPKTDELGSPHPAALLASERCLHRPYLLIRSFASVASAPTNGTLMPRSRNFTVISWRGATCWNYFSLSLPVASPPTTSRPYY